MKMCCADGSSIRGLSQLQSLVLRGDFSEWSFITALDHRQDISPTPYRVWPGGVKAYVCRGGVKHSVSPNSYSGVDEIRNANIFPHYGTSVSPCLNRFSSSEIWCVKLRKDALKRRGV